MLAGTLVIHPMPVRNLSIPEPEPTSLLREDFWQKYPLDQLTIQEWEALCDGCGLCCLVKLEDEDSGEVVYTKVACQLLDTQTAQCSDYPNRKQFVPDCLQLTPELVPKLNWLPSTCGYKRVYQGLDLPDWHPLITGKPQSVIPAKKSAAGRCISEKDIDPDEIEEYVVKWVR